MRKCQKTLFVETTTWSKSSLLYDFENKNPTYYRFQTNSAGSITKQRDVISFCPNMAFPSQLCYIDFDHDNNFFLSPVVNKNSGPLTPYIVIKSIIFNNDQKGYELTEGDIIKIGRTKFKVRKIYHHHVSPKRIEVKSSKKPKSATDNKDDSKVCRICYSSVTNEDNPSPLISPCHCTGSLKYVHLSCLKQWLMSKVNITINSKNTCIKYTLNPVKCEICKTFLPDYYKKDGKLFEICEFNSDYQNYISLETVISEKQQFKNIYVLNLSNDNYLYRIGRDHDSDVKVNDVTISRNHAGVFRDNDKVYLIDLEAKFGTTIMLQNNRFKFISNKCITLQIGSTLISFVQRDVFIKMLLCCFTNVKREYWDENKRGINFEKDYDIKVENDKSNENYQSDKDVEHGIEKEQKRGNGFVQIEGMNPEQLEGDIEENELDYRRINTHLEGQ